MNGCGGDNDSGGDNDGGDTMMVMVFMAMIIVMMVRGWSVYVWELPRKC